MDAGRQEKYERLLRELDTTLRAELERAADDAAPVEVDGRMGRISRGDAMQVQQMSLEMKRRRRERLLRVETAFQRIKEGTYGTCGRCRAAIGEARLDAFPDVVLCVQCASGPGR